MGQEAEHAQAIVERDQHHILGAPHFAVHFGLEAPAGRITAAMDPEGHGQFLSGLAGSLGPNIQIQAVLAEFRVAFEEELAGIGIAGSMGVLQTGSAEGIGHFHPFPRRYRLRSLPAEVAHRSGGIRDALVNINAFDGGFHPLHQAAVHLDDSLVLLCASCKNRCEDGHGKQSLFHMGLVCCCKFSQ